MTTARVDSGFELAWAEAAEARARRNEEPEWSKAERRAAVKTARGLGFPNREDDLWRRTDFRSLEEAIEGLQPFADPVSVRGVADLPAPLAERIGQDLASVALLVQRNESVVFEQPHPELAKQGVIVCSLERALREHGDLVRERLGALIRPDEDWYTAIGASIRAGGVFVHVPPGIEAAAPIRLAHWIDGAGRIAAPRSVIVIGAGSKATIVEEQFSETTEGISFHDGGTEVFVGPEAKLIFATHQDWGRNVFHYSNARARVDRDGELQWIQAALGSRMMKANSYFDLAGPGSQVFVHGFMFGDARQHFHLHTLQRHRVDHTTSDLLIKCCLKDRARSVYQGLIQVSEGAQRTDAYQANRNLLLSDKARADSIPGLEILANDVRCTHGATIGHVDDEQMHYLMARGLPRMDAQRLIVEGFFAPVVDRIPLESVREQLRQAIHHKIG